MVKTHEINLKDPNLPIEQGIAHIMEHWGYDRKEARNALMRQRHGTEKRTKNPDGTTTVIMFG
jgi:hypothetical protein